MDGRGDRASDTRRDRLSHEHSPHFFTKRLWSWRDEFGTEAEWSELLGRHMGAAGADPLWAEIAGG